jgi:hypothetical protein
LELKPIGVFGDSAFAPLARGHVEPLVDALDQDLRQGVASYLRSGAIVFALMEYTEDILGGRFGVSGGSGIATDGTYFWRQDAAAYVETYGVAIDAEAVALMRTRGWTAPLLSSDEVLAIDDSLSKQLRHRQASEGDPGSRRARGSL